MQPDDKYDTVPHKNEDELLKKYYELAKPGLETHS